MVYMFTRFACVIVASLILLTTACDRPSTKNNNSELTSLVTQCVAQHKKTRQVFKPASGLLGQAQLEALTDCVIRSHRSGENPCLCQIAACSPVTSPSSLPDVLADIFQNYALSIRCE